MCEYCVCEYCGNCLQETVGNVVDSGPDPKTILTCMLISFIILVGVILITEVGQSCKSCNSNRSRKTEKKPTPQAVIDNVPAEIAQEIITEKLAPKTQSDILREQAEDNIQAMQERVNQLQQQLNSLNQVKSN